MANLSEAVVKVRAELGNAAVVRPGDKLVVGVNVPIRQDAAHEYKQRLGELLPGVEVVLIDQCGGLAVYRDEQAKSKPLPNADLVPGVSEMLRGIGRDA